MGKKSVKRPKNDALKYDANLLSRDRSTLDAFLDEAAQDFIQDSKNQLPPVGGKIQAASVYGKFAPEQKQKPKSALLEAASQALGYSEPETTEDEYADNAVSALMQAAANVSGAISDEEYESGSSVAVSASAQEPVKQESKAVPERKPFKHGNAVSFGGNPRKLRIKDRVGNCIVIPSLVTGTDRLKVDSAKDAVMQWLRSFAILTMAPHAIFTTEDFIKRMNQDGIRETSGFTFLIPQELAPEFVLCYNMNDNRIISDWNVVADKLCEDYDDSTIAGIMISAMVHLYKNRWAVNLSSDAIENWMDEDNATAQDHFMFDLRNDEATMLLSRNATETNLNIMDYEEAIDCMVNGLTDYVDLEDYVIPEGLGDNDDEDGYDETAATPSDPGYYSEETRGASNDEEPFPDFDAAQTGRVFEGSERSSSVSETDGESGTESGESISATTSSDEEDKETKEAESGCSVSTDDGSGDDSVTAPEEKEEKETEVGNQRPELPNQGKETEEKDEESMVVGLICN